MIHPELATQADILRRTNFRLFRSFANVTFGPVERREDREKLVVITFDIRPLTPSHEWGILSRFLHHHQEDETFEPARVIGTRYHDIVQNNWGTEKHTPVYTSRILPPPCEPFFIEAGLCRGDSNPAVVEAYMLEQDEAFIIPKTVG